MSSSHVGTQDRKVRASSSPLIVQLAGEPDAGRPPVIDEIAVVVATLEILDSLAKHIARISGATH